MPEEVKHYQVGTRYRAVIERSATKGILGYKIEANGDDMALVMSEITVLKKGIEDLNPLPVEGE